MTNITIKFPVGLFLVAEGVAQRTGKTIDEVLTGLVQAGIDKLKENEGLCIKSDVYGPTDYLDYPEKFKKEA